MFPEVLPLTALVDAACSSGWTVEHLDTATQREWDEFESGWRRGQDPQVAAERMREYVTAYRGRLGFCYLILRA